MNLVTLFVQTVPNGDGIGIQLRAANSDVFSDLILSETDMSRLHSEIGRCLMNAPSYVGSTRIAGKEASLNVGERWQTEEDCCN